MNLTRGSAQIIISNHIGDCAPNRGPFPRHDKHVSCRKGCLLKNRRASKLYLFFFALVHYRGYDGDTGGDGAPGVWTGKIALF